MNRRCSVRQYTTAKMFSYGLLSLVLLLPVARAVPCQLSNGCPNLSGHNLDLSPLSGVWETVFFKKAEGSLGDNVPSFFNISVCGSVSLQQNSQCSGSSVCYSEHLDKFYSLGTTASCDVSYANRQVQFQFEYSQSAANIFGHGNVTVTLVCGRNLGIPEVIAADPNSHAIEIIWITSAACKNDSSLAAKNESKCYYIHAYEDQGIKAKLIDLTGLIRPSGYETTYAEREGMKLAISVCRPMEGMSASTCNGAMACLVNQSGHANIHQSVPLALGYQVGNMSNVHMEGGLLTVVYSSKISSCENQKRLVKVHFLCPSGIQTKGPSITFLDDRLCLIVINWYTSFACGTNAIESRGCQLTTSSGVTFDLSGLATKTEISGTSGGHAYLYDFQICSGNSLNAGCNGRPSAPQLRVTQTDPAHGGVCNSLGVGDGKLRYADGSLTLTYTLGDSCHSNFARTSVITFVCPESIGNDSNTTELSFSGEDNCFYEFEWITPLACGARTSGASNCQFQRGGNTYNFAPLVGRSDKNWVAIDDDNNTACFMVNPCGELEVTKDRHDDGTGYCNQRSAPYSCLGSSVCQVLNNGTGIPVGRFNLQNASTITTVDSNVLTVQGRMDETHTAMMHYVCKTGDLNAPPVFINVTNGAFYEFHWMTFAACPLGVTVGDGCMVTQATTGFAFNLSSLSPAEYDFKSQDKAYTYQISVCTALNHTHCPQNTSVCQVGKNSVKSAGNFNTSLVYADGTLKLHYNGGTSCHNHNSPHRNSTVLFECDSTAHTPSVSSVTEVNYCQYVVEMRTKLACLPAYQISECVYIDRDGRAYDFSELSKTTGNWQAIGPDGSVYYINVCHPLNKMAGCSPLAAVCKEKVTNGKTLYTNLGLASNINFTVVRRSSQSDRVVLRYNFTKSGAQEGECEVMETLIELVCNNSITVERGPRFESGGDGDNRCQHTFVWETRGACPVHTTRKEMSCTVTDSVSGYTFDLSPLHTNRSYFLVNSSTSNGPTWNITVCGALNSTCNTTKSDVGTVPVCQYASNSHPYTCGKLATQTIQYLDGSLSLRYTGGDTCHHVVRNRSVLINFECDNSVYIGEPKYVREENCDYTFEWPTALACRPRELECVAVGGKYDLRALLESQNWVVNTGAGTKFHYIIGGCRSLSLKGLSHCPAKPGMGACRYSSDGGEGKVLGYVTGDLVEESSGRLRLSYYNGDSCANGRKSVVHVYFQCAAGEGAGVPRLQEDSDNQCETRIEWLTQYACPLDTTASKSWVITNNITHQVFNLTTLNATLSRTYIEQDGTRYRYTIGLAGHPLRRCGTHTDNVGACQEKLGTNEAHLLGRINNSLQLLGGELRVEYSNGSFCTHVRKSRKAVITFECDSREFLQVLPEVDCEYSFIVHTSLACAKKSVIGVECSVDGFEDLEVFLSLKSPPVPLSNTSSAVAFVSVCDPISRDNQENSTALRCPSGAAACIVNGSHTIHLGRPDPHHLPTALSGGEGVILNYTQGDICDSTKGQRIQTTLLLVCNRNKPVGAPELINFTACQYIFRWESLHACRITLPSSPISKTVCNITDPTSHITYNFRNLVNQEHFVINKTNSNVRYYLELCGSSSSPPPGCDRQNTGICVTDNSGMHPKTILYADHKISITSRLPFEFEVVYPSGVRCGSDSSKKWTAFVTLQCDPDGGTQQPEFVSDENCELQLQWRNSSFCLGQRACIATDPHTRFIYNLDGLTSRMWTGLVADWNTKAGKSKEKGGTFTLAFCRNLNPFTSAGRHCSSPSGICWHSPDGKHINLGHLTLAPKVGYKGDTPIIHLTYNNGDKCVTDPTKKYHTDIFLTCGEEHSTPLLWQHNNCSFAITMDTPVACSPGKTNSSSCLLSQRIGKYNFNPLAHNITFMSSQSKTNYTVCLCPNSFCRKAGIWSGATSLGTFQRMTATSTLGGPQVLFTHGDNCPEGGSHVSYQSTIFMECNRSADPHKGNFIQQTLFNGCHKYFFWSTPYACLSEEISCTLSVESTSIFYDFTPLHSRWQPWTVQGTNNDQFLINICGAIKSNNNQNYKCSPESSVCLKRGDDYTDLATAGTQQIIATADGHVQIKFSGPKLCGGGKSHVTINMVCGIHGLIASSSDDCNYNFEWHTPYACKESERPTSVNSCQDRIQAAGDFVFYPKRLKNDYTVNDTDGTYHLSLCGPTAACSSGDDNDPTSVCLKKSQNPILKIGSYRHQKIIADGYWMRFQMDSGNRHAIVLVQCLAGMSRDQPQSDSVNLQNVVQTEDGHHYYYFQLYTQTGCQFEPPSDTTTPSHGNSVPSEGTTAAGGGGTAAGVIITLLVVVAVVAVVACILYKRERRQYVMKLVVRFFGSKASEPVRYHKLPTQIQDEETALLEEESEEEGEEGEEGGGKETEGGGEKGASDGDEELLNL